MNYKQTIKLTSTLFFVFALIAAVFISGCTEQPTEQEEGQAATITELTFGYQPSTHQIAYITARDKGWWAEDLAPYGIVEINDNLFPTGAPEMQSMLAGDIDVAYVGAAPVISALASGLDAKIVAAVQIQGSDIVLRTELPYESPEDLRGLKIATFPPGTIQDTLLKNWLKENGIDPEEDVEILGMGPGDAMTAISAGQVDAVFLPHPAPAMIESEGTGRSVVSSGEMLQDHACCVVAVSGELIREHPDIVQQIVETHVRATEYNSENLDEAAQIFADDQDWDVELVKQSLNEWDGTWVADPNLIINSTVDYAQVQYELGYISTPLTQDDIFDLSFYEALDQ
ncbi:ABC transporter substrate-binding protein [Methanolobus mangrovi]|uniref:ABC transporter substrate-binding protein n=1 Tax=Methanolobus mangrovi TaxID=3072977 RepID=A0AA51UI26_9EURY|nr:ABC transporter substrate-binding protein [Methanolobus mangrovi]WMW22091.1 ABC transporter substrate-binding protein [Methanolobus mangrovi]